MGSEIIFTPVLTFNVREKIKINGGGAGASSVGGENDFSSRFVI